MIARLLRVSPPMTYEAQGSWSPDRNRVSNGQRAMRFSTRIDTDIPAPDLFDILSDFSRSERALGARGVTVRRIDPAQEPGSSLGWTIDFDWRGQRRTLRLDVTRFDRPSHVTMGGHSDQFDLSVNISVVALSRIRSRLLFETEIRPRTLRARLLIQTARFGKAQLDRQYARRIADFVAHLRAT